MRERDTVRIVKRLQAASAYERALVLGIVSIVSAVLSWQIPSPFFIRNTPLLPALWFGLVLGAGLLLWATRSPLRIIAVLLATFVAWQAAVETTASLHDTIAQQIKSSAPASAVVPDSGTPAVDYLWGLCGMVGGMIGSGIVVFAIAAVLKGFRTSNGWAPPILFGTIAGFFLEFAEDPTAGGLFVHIGSVLPLFLVWQTAVAASIAGNLTKPVAGEGDRPAPSRPPS